MQSVLKRRKLNIPVVVAALAAFLCLFSTLEIEPHNAQVVASILLAADHSADHDLFNLIKVQDNESLDKSDSTSREDLEQALPHRSNNKNSLSVKQSQPACITKFYPPIFKLIHPPSNLVGANETYASLSLCLLFCSLLI